MTARAAAVALLCLAGLPGVSLAASPEQIVARAPVAALNVQSGVAVKGYDVVAYFTEGEPVKGTPEFTCPWT